MSRPLSFVLALLVAAGGAALSYDHLRLDSATMDEPFHALASAEYALSGTYFANLEHPPLAKLVAGISLGLAGGRPPRFTKPFAMKGAEQPRPFLISNDLPPDRLIRAARLPFPIVLFALTLLVHAAVARWAGPPVALAAAALIAFEPNFVAHAGVLHTDVPFALGFLGTLHLALLALESEGLGMWAAVGAALGATLATKFSAVFLVPVLLVLALVALLRRERRSLRPVLGLGLAFAVALAVLLGIYAAAMRHMSRDEAAEAIEIFLRAPVREATPATRERVLTVSRFCPPLGHYLAGLAGIAAQNRIGGGVNYLRGELSVEGFPAYFPIALAVKSSLGFLAALALGAALFRPSRLAAPRLLVVGTLAGASLYLLLNGMGTSYNIGLRHMLPLYPLLAVAVAVVVGSAPSARGALLALAACATFQLGETLSVHPHELSFFNLLVGGPAGGGAWLSDSNLDWGQDLTRLGLELRRRGVEGETTIAYFGGGHPPFDCPKAKLFDPAAPLSPGVYAVSSYLLTLGPEVLAHRGERAAAAGYERLRRALRSRGEPLGRVGYSILLFRLRAEPQP